MTHKFLKKSVVALLAGLLVFTNTVSAQVTTNETLTPKIRLNGTVAEGDSGYLNSKSIVLSSGKETKVNYRLVPDYSTGRASGVRAYIFLPSLEYVDGEYKVVDRDKTPTGLGVQGRVSAGGGWNVISDTTVQGGPIIMEYDGDLTAGTNPAFDIYLTTYNDGTEGVYGNVPEGTTFELNGFISYEMFNRVEGSSWTTPNLLDDESRVSVISSDLRWDTEIKSRVEEGEIDRVPIWDRYQYIDYEYVIKNTSENLKSDIDGYTTTFDIDSTDSSINGIIPFDINRWSYQEGGDPIKNNDPDYTEGQFIGVPGEGGVLIYDITDWDGESELEEIPYTYSGAGMIMIDREHGDSRESITPEGADGPTEKRYMISLPLSRQGFPSPPTIFRIRAITNILFAKSANWSKTQVVEREIVLPTFGSDFKHIASQADVVYGYETYLEVNDIKNTSDVPIHDTSMEYTYDENFIPSKVEFIFPEEYDFKEYIGESIKYNFKSDSGADLSKDITDFAVTEEDGQIIVSFDISEVNEVTGWDNKVTLQLTERIKENGLMPYSIRFYGAPETTGPVTNNALFKYIEKIASNDDLGNNTSYTDVEHTQSIDAKFNSIYPKEVIPQIQINIDKVPNKNTVKYGDRALFDILFGTNNTTANDATLNVSINTDEEVISDVELIVKKELMDKAKDPKVTVNYIDGTSEVLDLTNLSEGDLTIKLSKPVKGFTLDVNLMYTNGRENLISFTGIVRNGILEEYRIPATLRTYQIKPYDKNRVANATGIIEIQLPDVIVPQSQVLINKVPTRNTVLYDSRVDFDFLFGTNDIASDNATYTITVNGKDDVIRDLQLLIKKELFFRSDEPKFTIEYINGEIEELDLSKENKEYDISINLKPGVKRILINAEGLHTNNKEHLLSFSGVVNNGTEPEYILRTSLRAYQEDPYQADRIGNGNGIITIQLPDEVIPKAQVNVNKVPNRNSAKYESRVSFDSLLGTEDLAADNATYTIDVNDKKEVLRELDLLIKKELFFRTNDPSIEIEYINGDKEILDLSNEHKGEDISMRLKENVKTITINADGLHTNGLENLISFSGIINNGLLKSHTVKTSLRVYQEDPYDENRVANANGIVTILLPDELFPTVDVIGNYGSRSTANSTAVSYESIFDIDYKLNTGGVTSPINSYKIELLKPTGEHKLTFRELNLLDVYIDNSENYSITFVDKDGEEQSFNKAKIMADEITLDDIEYILITSDNLTIDELSTIVNIEFESNLKLGKSQTTKATFTGSQNLPYETIKVATKNNTVTTFDTKTTVKVEGVNQVSKGLGVGNDYSVDIYRYWNRYGRYSKQDYTLDQGYKSLGGFTSTLYRPTVTYANNDQDVNVSVDLPEEHFDLYYIKIREQMKDYITSVDIYRTVDGEEVLWKSIDGDKWVYNSQEKDRFWRINTARPGMSDDDLFTTHDSVVGVDNHPYYKDAWDEDAQPHSPVTKVDVNLRFTREDNNSIPQMSGTNEDIIEYMGRFHSTSETGKKQTILKTTDEFGLKDIETREASTSINSLVQYPFAQGRTGAHDNTSLSNKVIIMGNIGEYLTSTWNVNTASWSYYSGHGPDVYIPANTEYDEWLQMYNPEGFHDTLTHEFVYPGHKGIDDVYYYDSQYFTIENTSTLKYLSQVVIHTQNGDKIEIDIDEVNTTKLHFKYDYKANIGYTQNGSEYTIGLGKDNYPTKVESIFKEINGFGERTAEIDGIVGDSLGANLNEVDIRFGGAVSGNKALRGTTNLYRTPNDTKKRTLMHTSYATLTGYTPKLGASLGMKYDNVKVYDYKADGITPNETKVTLDLWNSSEADIKDITLNFVPDSRFRSNFVEIPAEIVNGDDWNVKSFTIKQGSKDVKLDLLDFTLNHETNRYELDLNKLFDDKVLAEETYKTTVNGDVTLVKRHINSISVEFSPTSNAVALWGSLRRGESEEELPIRMIDGGTMFITGDWIDKSADGEPLNSMPTFVTEATKSSNEVISSYTSFNTNAIVTAYQPLFVSAGGGNNGQKPSLTQASSVNSSSAPRLYNRVARMNTKGTHLTNDNIKNTSANLFYDEDTDKQIAYNNITVGDTTKVLYELSNVGVKAQDNLSPGNIPIFNPVAHIEIPKGLQIVNVVLANNELKDIDNLMDTIENSTYKFIELDKDNINITETTDLMTIRIDDTIEFGEAIFIYVEYEAINSFDVADDFATQNKTTQWNFYARPGFTHNYMSYDRLGVNDNYTTGTNVAKNLDKDNVTEHLSRIYNTAYRFANPNKLKLSTKFTHENVSGEEFTMTTSSIINELLHSNTRLQLFYELDTDFVNGFELTEFPTPAYPEGYIGEYDKPIVLFKFEDKWIDSKDFDNAIHDMKEINELQVDYGKVDDVYDDKPWEAPSSEIKGIAHWQAQGSRLQKYDDLPSKVRIEYSHYNDSTLGAKYQYTTSDTKRLFKAMPTVEFNLQSFNTKDEAFAVYSGSSVGKTDYVANDTIWYKMTAKNHTTDQGINTNTAYGKGPLRNPIFIDKIPEYLTTELSNYIKDGVLDVNKAIADEVLTIRVTNREGEARDFNNPTATVDYITGLDVAGDQTFANDKHNDTWGHLSSGDPSNVTLNPAKEINFTSIRYEFDKDDLGRGEIIEIIYKAQARPNDLPYAKYANGKPVYAPLNGWYGLNNPVSNDSQNTSMDMSSLLHDAGITGNRGHEMESVEFLTTSYAWQPGGNTSRRSAGDTTAVQATFYDASANKRLSHLGYLRETANNTLYEHPTSGSVLEQNMHYASKVRVNDGKVTEDERIMWTQDGLQLNRAWIYGASEMVPDVERKTHGTDNSNFYEHDGSLNNANNHRHGYTPYLYDNYTYAVELHELFTVKLHGVNMGDRSVLGGMKYTEILPLGITPYDKEGNLLGITAYDGNGDIIDNIEYKVIQTPEDDKGYKAPNQSQEAGTHKDEYRDDMVPYVIEVLVKDELSSRFNGSSNVKDKYQEVHIRAQVYEEVAPDSKGITYWHDELTVEPILDEEYYEIYDNSYGGFHHTSGQGAYGANRNKFYNDGMKAGLEVNDTYYTSYYGRHFAYEPYGMYVRGLNAQGVTVDNDGKKVLVTGDQIAMRKPTLRVWGHAEKDSYDNNNYDKSINDFYVDLYEEFNYKSIVENQQLEVLGEYNRVSSGYNYYSGDNYNDDIWVNAPQTIGGARGGWFEPTNTIVLPYGIVPVLKDGTYSRYYNDIADLQDIKFEATINDIKYNSSVVNKDVTDLLDVEVFKVELDGMERFVLSFTPKDKETVDVAYGQSLVITPRVVTIDNPAQSKAGDYSKYQEVITIANSVRDVFNPIVSARYKTGAVPSLTARDQGNSTRPNNIKSSNGLSITQNDRTRLDTTSTWNSNFGKLRITERLISDTKVYDKDSKFNLHSVGNSEHWVTDADSLKLNTVGKHDKTGAYGGSTINLKHSSIKNETKTSKYDDSALGDNTIVDAAGKYWYSTKVKNELIKNNNPYVEIKTTGDIHNSRFLVTHYVTNFAEVTNEVRIIVDGVRYDRSEFEELGFRVEQVTPEVKDVDGLRSRIQWLVTTPENKDGTPGVLKSGDDFTLMYQVNLTNGFDEKVIDEDSSWVADELIVDSYVSLISDDKTLTDGVSQDELDFITQRLDYMTYTTHKSDKVDNVDIDSNGDMEGLYAHDSATIEILKPKAEVRKNTTRPRIRYSNGMSGDTYFNSSDIIEYLITYAKITGSGLREFVVEDIIPTHETNDSSIETSRMDINTNVMYVSTGKWEMPQDALDRIEANGKDIDKLFRTFVYVSDEIAEDGYEDGNWALLNEGGTSITTNEELTIPNELRMGIRKVRIVVRAMDPENYLVPNEFRLDIDADKETDGKQEVVETDPENHSVDQFPDTVTDNAIKFGMRISSDAKTTLFIHNTAQAWGNYVSSKFAKLDQSSTRSYLTPSRPVVNVHYNTLYYRSDNTKPQDERFGWSDITTIAPKSSPHLKLKGEFTNASEDMWNRDEDNTYAEDTLINPFVTFQLPTVMESGKEFTYVPNEEIDETHPLSSDHRSRYSLTDEDSNQWTWRIERANGDIAESESYLSVKDFYSGPWSGLNRNIVSVWFDGIVYPGDKVVVEFIGEVDAYAPGAEAEDLKSIAMVSNNTGLLHPLNSRQNASNKLGYNLDNFDLNSNNLKNDRLVFAERTMFQYETYDNFGKRKVAYSDLNLAGTTYPEATPVRQGGDFIFELSVDNSKENIEKAYPYPIFYDVLPHKGDTSITNDKMERNSSYTAWLKDEGMKLEIEGTNKKVYKENEYTVYVGPFKKVGKDIVDAEMISHEYANTEAFYDDLGLPGKKSEVRDNHFVELKYIKDNEELLKKAKTILVLFNNANEELPGQNKLKFTYQMKSPINAPVSLYNNDYSETAIWNSFMATQRVSRFIPQESNNAGIFATEQVGKAYLGSYVWNDINYNKTQDEGVIQIDSNGRKLQFPAKDFNGDGVIDDSGINEVKVTLVTELGYNVDYLGQPIHLVGNTWEVVDELTGESVLDDVFLLPIESDGPLITYTETDFNGNMGYYVFSNITEGDYRVIYEFPEQYDDYNITTDKVFKGNKVNIYTPNSEINGIHAEYDNERLIGITDVVNVTRESTDKELMNFNIGVGRTVEIGGTIFKEEIKTLNGLIDKTEKGIEDYYVYLRNLDGTTVKDENGLDMITKSDKDGKYSFIVTPFESQYYIEVKDTNNEFNADTIVSPIIHNINPFEEMLDNDGFTPKGETIVKTNLLNIDISELFETNFAPKLSVNVGFYDKSTFGVIGNRVWDDLNRDGIQDEAEPGLANQELRLEQYIKVDGEWELTNFTMKTTSNQDGYYYFKEVPSKHTVGSGVHQVTYETRYQVVIDEVIKGYTFSLPYIGDNYELDSDFYKNGTMNDGDLVNLINLTENINGVDYGVDNNTIDLGLTRHALSSLSGSTFIDSNEDGINNDDNDGDIFTFTLEVNSDKGWIPVRIDEDGMMIEPADAKNSDEIYSLTDVKDYEFNNLHIINNNSLDLYEYRVVATGISLTYGITELNVGDNKEIDNDYTNEARGDTYTAISTSRLLSELDDSLIGSITYTDKPAYYVDLGLVALEIEATIGDYVWYDINKDGIQDSNEVGVKDIKVTLLKVVDDELIEVNKVTTDDNGYYEFTVPVADENDNIITYVTEFNLTSRQELSKMNINDGSKDSQFRHLMIKDSSLYRNSIPDPRHSVVSREVQLADFDENNKAYYETTALVDNLDGGIIPHESIRTIGDTIYEDVNEDGIQNNGEIGIEGLTVSLYRHNKQNDRWEAHTDANGVSQLTTDVNGKYAFDVEVADLHKDSPSYRTPYEYKVIIESTSNMRLVEVNNFFNYYTDFEFDSIDVENPYSYVVSPKMTLVDVDDDSIVDLNTAFDIYNADAGFKTYDTDVVIGGKVWEDENLDGLSTDELAIEGQVVTLWKKVNGAWEIHEDLDGVSTLTTDKSGEYRFRVAPTNYDEHHNEFLMPYEYKVTTTREGNQVWSPINVGDDIMIDSDIDNAFGEGFKDSVHEGVTHKFNIYEVKDNLVDQTTVTDDVQMDIGIKTYNTDVIIGGKVWEDENIDGLKDEHELLTEGQEITLWRKSNNNWVIHEDLDGNSSVITNELGEYRFRVEATNYDEIHEDYLLPYEYKVTTTREGHQSWSPINIGDNELIDSDIDNAFGEGFSDTVHEGVTHSFDIINSIEMNDKKIADVSTLTDDVQMDIGIKTYNTDVIIGGKVWEDENLDGLSTDELPTEGHIVTLWKLVNDKWVIHEDLDGKSTQVTNESGEYRFRVEATNYDETHEDYLMPYEYKVTSVRDGNQAWSPVNIGDDNLIDSDIDNAFGLGFNDIVHEGVTHTFDIINSIEMNDKLIADISTLTDDVQMDIGLKTYDTYVIIGGKVWEDTNFDGVQDIDELATSKQELTLWRLNGDTWEVHEDLDGISSIITDETGEYRFRVEATNYDEAHEDYLLPYEYKVTTTREGYQAWSPLNVGDDKFIDSDINSTDDGAFNNLKHEGVTHLFNISKHIEMNDKSIIDISSLTDDVQMDIGIKTYRHSVVIGGKAWEDMNEDGIYDSNEIALPGQEFTLWRLNGNTWEIHNDINETAIAISDDNGEYRFEVQVTNFDEYADDYLIPYEYKVTTEREGYQLFSPANVGDDILIDSDINDSIDTQWEMNKHLGYSTSFTTSEVDDEGLMDISTIKDDITVDMGLTTYVDHVYLGGSIWLDGNEDGLINTDDEGMLEDYTVNLWVKENDSWVATEDLDGISSITTDSSGSYLFRVEATSYNQDSDNYLIPYEYKVTVERNGNERWTEFFANEDKHKSSKVISAYEVDYNTTNLNYNLHTGVINSFELYETLEDGTIDVRSLSNDTWGNAGLIHYDTEVEIGSQVWFDSNYDGLRNKNEAGVSDVEVTLQRYDNVTEQWMATEDLRGVKSIITNTTGLYSFIVSPTEYELNSKDYLAPTQYRVSIALPEGKLMTMNTDNDLLNSDHLVTTDGHAYSRNANLIDVYDDNEVDISTLHNDLTIDFGLVDVEIPVDNDTDTGVGRSNYTYIITIASSALILIALKRRRRLI